MRHWAAFRMAETIPICRAGTDDESLPEGDETTLSDERCDCPDCRRVLGLDPIEVGKCRHDVRLDEACEACGEELLDEQADRLLQAILEEGS